MKGALFLLLTIGALVIGYLLLCGIGGLWHGYSWQEMDWNQDGNTSLSEFFAASDIGKREVAADGKKCIEYYAYKDGLAVKMVCQK